MGGRAFTMEKGELCRADGRPLSAEDALRAGLAAGRMKRGGAVGAGRGDSPAARALLLAAESGVLQSGSSLWGFGSCFESQFLYCCGRSGASGGIFVDFAGRLRPVSGGGLPLSLEEEEQFLRLMEEPARLPASGDGWGACVSMGSLREMYRVELFKAAETGLSGLTACVKCANPLIRRLMEEAMAELGCRVREGGVVLQISADGRDISAYQEVQDYIFTDRVLCLVCLDLFRRGQDAAVPASAPRALDGAAAAWGRRLFRYEDGFPSPTDRKARALGARQLFLRDGPMLGMRLLSILRRNGGGLAGLQKDIPVFAQVSRTIPAGKAAALRAAVLSLPLGELRVRPVRGGRFAFLAAESGSMEAAEELCRLGEEKIAAGEAPDSHT